MCRLCTPNSKRKSVNDSENLCKTKSKHVKVKACECNLVYTSLVKETILRIYLTVNMQTTRYFRYSSQTRPTHSQVDFMFTAMPFFVFLLHKTNDKNVMPLTPSILQYIVAILLKDCLEICDVCVNLVAKLLKLSGIVGMLWTERKLNH